MMVIFKSCPRCSGDRSVERDMYGVYVICLACGHVTYPDVGAEARANKALQERKMA